MFAQKAAEAGSASLAAYLRECVLRSQVIARPRPSPDRGRVLFLMNKASNNINQLAHQVNAAAKAGAVKEHLFEQLLGRLDEIASYMRSGTDHVD